VSSLAARAPSRFNLEINISELLAVVVADNKAGVLLFRRLRTPSRQPSNCCWV
jgi:hypothetical protein